MGGFTRRGVIGLGAAAALLPWAGAAASQPPGGDALGWLRGAARPLDTHDPAPAELQPLVAAFGDAQVIGLGEATSGSHEDRTFKAALVRALVIGGDVRALAIECNRRPANQLDSYVRGGGGDPVTFLRQPSIPQHLQSEEFLGLLTWLRAWNMTGRQQVRIVGMDVQALGADAWEAFRWLEEVNPDLARTVQPQLAPLFRDERLREGRTADLLRSLTPGQQADALVALDRLRALILTLDRGGQQAAAAAALSARQSLQIARGQGGAGATQLEAAARAGRNRLMAENLIAQRGDARTIYWGHNLDVAAGAGGTGHFLRRRLAGSYRVLLFEYDGGRVNVKPSGSLEPRPDEPWQVAERQSVAGGLGPILQQAALARFWLDLAPAAASQLATEAHPHDWPGSSSVAISNEGRLPLAGNADLLVFIRNLTPSRLLPFVPQR